MLSREYMRECLNYEMYLGMRENISVAEKVWAHFFRPQTNVIIHLRKMQYYHGRCEVISKIHGLILNRRWGIYINPNAEIQKGVYFPHPTSICMTNVRIGKNFTCLQNCTIGSKVLGMTDSSETPYIGNNVTVYANSLIIGNIRIADNVTIGGGSCVVKNADVCGGVYCGSPARLLKKQSE